MSNNIYAILILVGLQDAINTCALLINLQQDCSSIDIK